MWRTARCRLELSDLDSLDLLEATLRLPGLGGLGAKSLDPRALLGDDRLRSRNLGGLALVDGRLFDHERAESAGVGGDRFVVDIEDAGRDVVEKPFVVRNHDGASAIAVHELLEPANREDVEMVR